MEVTSFERFGEKKQNVEGVMASWGSKNVWVSGTVFFSHFVIFRKSIKMISKSD